MRGLIHEISRIRENPASPCKGAFHFCPYESGGECDDNMNCPECWEHYAMEEAKKRLGIEHGKS